MRFKITTFLVALFATLAASGQSAMDMSSPDYSFRQKMNVGSGVNTQTPNSSAFHVLGTTRGSRPWPALTTAQRNAIASPAAFLTVINTDVNRLQWYVVGTGWMDIAGTGVAGVSSVFSRTGAVTAQSGDYSSDQVTEGSTNVYHTPDRARAAVSAGTGLTYSSSTGVFSLNLSAGSGLTYNSGTGVISADFNPTISSPSSGHHLRYNGTSWVNGPILAGDLPTTNTISSLQLSTPNVLFTSPVTFSNTGSAWTGSLSLNTQAANKVLAGPTTGSAAAPTFRPLVAADLPNLGDNYLEKDAMANGYWYKSEFTHTSGEWTYNGTVAPVNATGETNHTGIARMSTGTSSSGWFAFQGDAFFNTYQIGGGTWVYEAVLRVNTLSTSTERYALAIGFGTSVTTLDWQHGVWFLYDNGTATTGSLGVDNWQICTARNNTRTFANSGIAVNTSWTKLRFEVNSTGTSIRYFVNGVEAANSPITTNIPTANGLVCSGCTTTWLNVLRKSAGTSTRTVDMDYNLVYSNYTTPR